MPPFFSLRRAANCAFAFSCVLLVVGSCQALAQDAPASQETPAPPVGGAPVAAEAAPSTVKGEEKPAPESLGWTSGLDIFGGLSNIPGIRRARDKYFAGSSASIPSLGYLQWQNAKSQTARVAVGLGPLYNGSDSSIEQPAEAWFQQPAGQWKLTAGKFYTPFARQEWIYESKPGIMAAREWGATGFSTSYNYNRRLKRGNAYGRLGRAFGPSKRVQIGISAAAGRGLAADTSFNRALGLDGELLWRKWRLDGEYTAMRNANAAHFRYLDIRITRNPEGRISPSLTYYRWRDSSDEFGSFRSLVPSVTFQLTPQLALDAAYALAQEKNLWWLQLHYTVEG